MIDVEQALQEVGRAVAAGELTAGAGENLRIWLSEPQYAHYLPTVLEHVADERWQVLDDVFWTVIPFGTGGRRGKMYPIGSNAINERTIGESAQGLADYVRSQHPAGAALACAIAYDTRHRSRQFAELCAEIMAAAGFKVWFLDGYRSTPELSFAVRHKQCACGIMVTASHNPPSDNAVKAYWSTGGQLLPPHDRGVIDRVMSTKAIERIAFSQALAAGQVVYCQTEVDAAWQQQVLMQGIPGPRDLKIIYSPLHGVGAASVMPVLAAAGFSDVELFALQAEPNGDFPNVPGHVSNPENPAVFDSLIERAQKVGADLVMATDPDADRLGCAAPTTRGGPWKTFTGNQIGALLTDFVLAGRRSQLTPNHYVVKTLVTSEMIRRIADSYGVKTYGDLQVGFKYIGGTMDDVGPANFVLGTEESHGYLLGQYARDKDATVAALLLAQLAAQCRAEGKTLHEKFDALSWQFGCHVETQISKTMPGSEGMSKMKQLMAQLRSQPPRELAGLEVSRMRDFAGLVELVPGGQPQPFVGPKGDMVIIDLKVPGSGAMGNYVAIRPSGTEPKVKFYMFAFEPAEMLANLEDTRQELNERLARIGNELSAIADAI